MKLRQLGEFGLIDQIRRGGVRGRGVRIGIGDDCAWVDQFAGSSLITADLLIEDVHFDLKWTSLDALGHKSLAVNLSDIAAMGGTPTYAVVSLGIPRKFDSAQVGEFYRGFNRLAKRYGVALVGGDTNLSRFMIISICLIGNPPARPVQRGGAQAGDDIYVTGTLGDSALGLAFLRGRLPGARSAAASRLLARHHRPMPRVALGAELARRKLAAAMIDISDGLLQDLGHICRASDTGASIWHERLPLSGAYRRLAGKLGTHPALNGGEDYELLFCARPRHRESIEKLSAAHKLRITRIGRCLATPQSIAVIDRSGQPIPVEPKGHDHFKI
jgi:thiamine-monophosphate kinase